MIRVRTSLSADAMDRIILVLMLLRNTFPFLLRNIVLMVDSIASVPLPLTGTTEKLFTVALAIRNIEFRKKLKEQTCFIAQIKKNFKNHDVWQAYTNYSNI